MVKSCPETGGLQAALLNGRAADQEGGPAGADQAATEVVAEHSP